MESAEVYILHFDRPYWRTCRHYVGYTKIGVEERVRIHRAGNGSRLVRYAINKGIDFTIALVEQYSTIGEARKRELQLKRGRNLKRMCPICRGKEG